MKPHLSETGNDELKQVRIPVDNLKLFRFFAILWSFPLKTNNLFANFPTLSEHFTFSRKCIEVLHKYLLYFTFNYYSVGACYWNIAPQNYIETIENKLTIRVINKAREGQTNDTAIKELWGLRRAFQNV